MKKISFYLFMGFKGLTKIMPFWLIYGFSNIVYVILFHIIGYRKSVISKNLKRCFPDLSEKELKSLRKKFYKSLSDLMLESIKGLSMSKEELIKRFKAVNSEVADKFFDQGKDVIVLVGHFANWEWATATLAVNFKHQPAVLYKPMTNEYIDLDFHKSRARFGIELVSIHKTGEYFMKKKPKPVAYYMIADQYPPKKSQQKFATFFGSKTAFLHGPEKYSKQLDIPVIYAQIRRVKRGYYTIEMIDVTDNPKILKENELTQMYADILEKSIKLQPENWVWSHKRWKNELY